MRCEVQNVSLSPFPLLLVTDTFVIMTNDQ